MYTRELFFIEMWAGQLLCEAFNWVLKHIIKEERPYSEYSSLHTAGDPCRSGARYRSTTDAPRRHRVGSAQPRSRMTSLTICLSEHMGPGYGFPSSHSQWMGYFVAFLLCHLIYRHHFVSTGSPLLDKARSFVIYSGIVAWSAAVAFSRYVGHAT